MNREREREEVWQQQQQFFTVHNEIETVDDDDRNDKTSSQRIKDSGGTRRISFVWASFRIFFTFVVVFCLVCSFVFICKTSCCVRMNVWSGHAHELMHSIFSIFPFSVPLLSMCTHYTFCPYSNSMNFWCFSSLGTRVTYGFVLYPPKEFDWNAIFLKYEIRNVS